MLPKWAEGIEDVVDQVIRSHGETVNIPRQGAAGTGVHVGIVDSACELPPDMTESYRVRQGPDHSFVETDESMTTDHCGSVFDWLSTFCPKATFSLYQAVDEDGTLPLDSFSDAITRAIEDGVDILNISVGDPWRGPVHVNPAVREVERAVDQEITVVAAAGNYNPRAQGDRPPVHCPAAFDPVIAVGGMEVLCPVAPGSEPDGEPAGPYYCIPPEDGADLLLQDTDRSFCSQNGCVGGESCISNSTAVEWEFNPQPTGGKPDILAPMHRPTGSTDGPHFLKSGTSFATPTVAASIGCIYSELLEMERELPRPRTVRGAVVEGGFPVDDSPHKKYDAMGTREALGIV